MSTKWLNDPEVRVENILSKVGKHIVVGLPLGLGKANTLLNALYRRAERDSSITLEIYTALTLARPQLESDLERRFVDPLFKRLAGNYPELAYNRPLQEGILPANTNRIDSRIQCRQHDQETHLAQGTSIDSSGRPRGTCCCVERCWPGT